MRLWGREASLMASIAQTRRNERYLPDVPIGERVSGWVFANRQAIPNAEAVLELGDALKACPVPLAYALAVPVIDAGRCAGVIALFSADRFSADHQRLVETAVNLLPREFLNAAAS